MCVCVCIPNVDQRGGPIVSRKTHVARESLYVVVVWGAHACVVGGGFGAVRIPFVMVQQTPSLPIQLSLSISAR